MVDWIDAAASTRNTWFGGLHSVCTAREVCKIDEHMGGDAVVDGREKCDFPNEWGKKDSCLRLTVCGISITGWAEFHTFRIRIVIGWIGFRCLINRLNVRIKKYSWINDW